MMLRVSSELLPDDAHARHSRLRTYFCDIDAEAVRIDGGWRLELAWPSDPERHVDIKVRDALSAWGGIGLDGMATARHRSGRVLTSFYDTWSLLTWCEWAARAKPAPTDQITILHLDDHRDLMSPRLAIEGDELVDMITDKPFDVMDPASVLSACDSGAVGMGSFLTPFLLAFPNCNVRHLCQPPKVDGTCDWRFRAAIERDDLLRPGVARPAIALEAARGTGPGGYRATNDVEDWLADIGDGPILLHVDMDYFNNRYDGDGDWMDRMRSLDPPLEAVIRQIDKVCAAMRDKGLIERIEDAAVAFSPGFFPSEMWQAADARLRQNLASLYD